VIAVIHILAIRYNLMLNRPTHMALLRELFVGKRHSGLTVLLEGRAYPTAMVLQPQNDILSPITDKCVDCEGC
jgi:hypothetical protein